MTIDQTHTDSLTFSLGKSSHRTRPEQLVGLGIYLLICLGLGMLSRLTINFLGTLYFISLALGMWALWRKYSLRVIKLELFAFSSQFLFQIAWSFSFFALQQSLLSLVALLLLWCNTLLAALLFWKRDRISGMLFLYPLVWVIYLVGLNMVTCMSKS